MTIHPPAKAFITGCAGARLSREEIHFLRDERPLGLILFKRNCRESAEISDLVAAFRDAVGNPLALVLIDQEGGRIQRLEPPIWPQYPAAGIFGALAQDEVEEGERAAYLAARLIAADLTALGISVDCLPVLDLAVTGSHAVIGERAYGQTPNLVARLGRAAANGLLEGGVLPVIKHIPGHGRAEADSHLELPVVTTPALELEKQDFAPFAALSDLPLAMTAHVVYRAIDPAHPATLSAIIIDKVIRGHIGFEGLLMSDDLSMGALSGDMALRTKAALGAGCDVGLHCNGDFGEMNVVAGNTPELAGLARERAISALAALHPPKPFDAGEGREELLALTTRAGWPPRPEGRRA